MRFFPNLFDRTKQNHQASYQHQLGYHGPNQKYKIIHQALVIPNLPAPIRYLNLSSFIGQPNLPIFQNSSLSKVQAQNTATVLASISPHMVGHLNYYSVLDECFFNTDHFYYLDREKIVGTFPNFHISRSDAELSFDIDLHASHQISHFSQMHFGIFQYWSMLVTCKGRLQYQNQQYDIDSLASYEYARSVKLPYLPIAFLVYQVINLQQGRQLLLMQFRDGFNHVLNSRLYLRDINLSQSQYFDQNVHFIIHRIFPSVKTPKGKTMYLPREFEWRYQSLDGTHISVFGNCRGDYKFGLGAGYVGSFDFEIYINNKRESGEGAYIQYIDCRSLKYQEIDELEKKQNYFGDYADILCKK